MKCQGLTCTLRKASWASTRLASTFSFPSPGTPTTSF